MSRVLPVKAKDLHKNQQIMDKVHDLIDKAYYVDPILYKMDNTAAYQDSSLTE